MRAAQRRRAARDRAAGFTLLEVMIALAILALSLTVISQTQQASMRQVLRAKKITIATMLARWKMVEVEDELFEEGFSDHDEEDKGDFDDAGFKDFRYLLKVEKVEFPAEMNAETLADAVGGGESGDGASGSTAMAKMGGSFFGRWFEMFRNVLEQGIRRVSVQVAWKEGKIERAVSVVGYFTDPRKVDAAAGFGGGVATGTGTTGTGTTGSGRTGTGTTGSSRTGTTRTGTTRTYNTSRGASR